MASSAQPPLMSDLKDIGIEPPEGCSASPFSDENLFVWSATIFGPDETPWEVAMLLSYNDGTLCMDIIQDAWSPCHNICTILTSIQSLLTDPNPASPANPEAAHMFQHVIQAYNRSFRRCARRSIES